MACWWLRLLVADVDVVYHAGLFHHSKKALFTLTATEKDLAPLKNDVPVGAPETSAENSLGTPHIADALLL